MKGLKIEAAKPSNCIDIYALLQMAAKEGALRGKPNSRQLKAYYFDQLLPGLADRRHTFLIAKRGRAFLGFAHAYFLPSGWDGSVQSLFIDQIFVVDHKRKQGIGAKMLAEFKEIAQNMGIKRLEFLCPVNQVEFWTKKHGAKTEMSLMGVEI